MHFQCVRVCICAAASPDSLDQSWTHLLIVGSAGAKANQESRLAGHKNAGTQKLAFKRCNTEVGILLACECACRRPNEAQEKARVHAGTPHMQERLKLCIHMSRFTHKRAQIETVKKRD